jgi:hypothetical protein
MNTEKKDFVNLSLFRNKITPEGSDFLIRGHPLHPRHPCSILSNFKHYLTKSIPAFSPVALTYSAASLNSSGVCPVGT